VKTTLIKKKKAILVPSTVKLFYQQTKKAQSERSNRVPEGKRSHKETKVYINSDSSAEPGGCRKHNFWTHVSRRLKFIYLESSCQELSIGICMDPIRGGGGGSPDVVIVFSGGGLQFFSGPLPRKFKHIIGILSLSPVDWHPF